MIVSSPSCGFKARGDWTHTIALLDGVQTDCIYADDAKGKIIRLKPDAVGRCAVDVLGDLILETNHGRVTLISQRKFKRRGLWPQNKSE